METKNQIPEQWNFYFSRVEDEIASIRLNMGLYEVAPLQEYPFRVIFSLQMNEPEPSGLGSDSDFQRFQLVEDTLDDALKDKNILYVGTCRNKGLFKMFFYAKNEENWQMIFDQALDKLQEKNYNISIVEEPQWETYFDFLYPNIYEYQAISNREICFHLEQAGDKMEQERDVDFWAYFPSQEKADAFAQKIAQIGYIVHHSQLLEAEESEQEPTYRVWFSKTTNVLWGTINQLSWNLIDLAQEFDGCYDGWETIIVKD